LLIPLTKEQSRGDQILNAQSFESSGFCRVLYEDQMTSETLVNAVNDVYKSRQELIANMMKYERHDALSKVVELIKQVANS
jgi:UDP-N-acetylglucosamine--N-acetylmuramyl-(pentapeptide) pyrophosphoryl-undecaprenol N-acetylglucosamine transferase